ncbi:SphA family protein [Rhizobium leguminosarum]|uniref:Phenol degradation protein meta n=1 Tax=Rhizobium leguminosarum TaxID=384 RepID=A0A7W9ZU49_RHILE|nr:transporter [Rhizobium leguminosarum]MBB6222873.1 hypothetical protein [Rhizobium leguminosarum]
MKTSAYGCALGLAAGATIFNAFCFVPGVFAAENGATITPFGVTDFGAGMLPPSTPFGTVGVRTAYYSADVVKNGKGDRIDNDFDLTVKTIGLAYIHMSETELFGASVGFGTIIPLMDINGSLTVPTPGGPFTLAGEDFALGDIQIMPLMLQWNAPPNLFVNASLQVQAPTGSYDVNEPFNVGTNHWAIAPLVGLTYLTDSGFEISSRIELNFNTKNPDTDYTSGVEYKQEFAVGQHFGPWTLGAGGYVYQQLSDDTGPTAGDGNRGRVMALGPAISFFEPGLPVMSLHAYREFAAENRAEGVNVAFRIGMAF